MRMASITPAQRSWAIQDEMMNSIHQHERSITTWRPLVLKRTSDRCAGRQGWMGLGDGGPTARAMAVTGVEVM